MMFRLTFQLFSSKQATSVHPSEGALQVAGLQTSHTHIQDSEVGVLEKLSYTWHPNQYCPKPQCKLVDHPYVSCDPS